VSIVFKIPLQAIGYFSKKYGRLGILLGFGFLIMISIQRFLFHPERFPTTPKIDFKLYFYALQKIWFTYIPFMILIGCMYYLSGYFISVNNKKGKMLLIVSSILNIVWYILYAIASKHYILPLMINAFPPSTFVISYLSTGLAVCCYPFFLLIYLPFIKE
jgi:hypothetical protein